MVMDCCSANGEKLLSESEIASCLLDLLSYLVAALMLVIAQH